MASESQFMLQTFNTPIAIKLDDENFLMWYQQVLATVRGLKLKKYINGKGVPEKYSNKEDEVNKIMNQGYLNYVQQDQSLVAWLLASMSLSILTKMVGLDTSEQIWKRLEAYYASHTKATIKKLKFQLRTVKKEKGINEFLLEIKRIVDSLAAFGVHLSDEDHIDAILVNS